MTAPAALMPRLEAARAVLEDAAALGLAYFAKAASLAVEHKTGGQDVVTAADRDIERMVRQRLGDAFPDDGFLGEEYGSVPARSDFLWVLDPVDGTSCFVHGIRSWCIALALLERGRTVAGFILDPTAGELFVAVEGAGATLNGQPIRVDTGTDLRHGLTSVGANRRVPAALITGFIQHLLRVGGMFVRSGSGALSLAHVACGRLAAYYEPHMHAWDCLAGLLLIREAGGWTNAFPAEGDLARGGAVIGCAPQLCEDLLGLIEAARMETAA